MAFPKWASSPLAIKALCLVVLSMQFPVDLAACDVPVARDFNLSYQISDLSDYRDYVFLSSVEGESAGAASIVPGNGFIQGYDSGEFRIYAIKSEDFDNQKFDELGASYLQSNPSAIPSNSSFPSTVEYEASLSVLPDEIAIFLKIGSINEGTFNISRDKARYHYPDGYVEEVPFIGSEPARPPHHYSRHEELPGGFGLFSAMPALIISAFVLRLRKDV